MKRTLIAVVLALLVLTPGCKRGQPSQQVVQSVSMDLQLVDLIPRIMESVVHVQCPGWQGSGFVVSEHLIATARHVVDGVVDFEITFNDGTKIFATKALSSKKYDIGFIWVEEPIVASVVKLGSIKECPLGTSVVVIGSSYGITNFNCISTGIISGLDRDWNEIDTYAEQDYGWEWGFTADASGSPGNSGCPLFTMDGVVRGILVGGYDSTHVFYMPSDLFLNDLGLIQLMFIMDKYQFEAALDVVSLDLYTERKVK